MHYQKSKSQQSLMSIYANSGQNKLKMPMKKLTLISIKGKNLVSRQFMCTCNKNITVFIKNDIHILKLFLTVAARKSLFLFLFYEENIIIGIMIFWAGEKNCIVKNKNCIVFSKSQYVNLYLAV